MEEQNLNNVERILFAACEKFSELLAESEERINTTNDILNKLAEASQLQNEVIYTLTNKHNICV